MILSTLSSKCSFAHPLVVACLLVPSFAFTPNQPLGQPFSILSASASVSSSNNSNDNIPFDTAFQPDSPVLEKLLPDIQKHCQEHGHPNIPLGTSAGRQCETLRRLHIQQKLTSTDIQFLEEIGFRFYSLEQVYETSNFDELLERLKDYHVQTGDWSPPKKYAPDPELGAWVTGIRRKGRDNLLDPAHVQALDELGGFQWQSPRKCGSQFMMQYRDLLERAENDRDLWADREVQQWVRAQQEAAKRGGLSETRKHYMETLLYNNKEWISQSEPWNGK